MTTWPLSRRGAGGGLEAYKVNINAPRHTPPEVEKLHDHEGYDWV